MKKDKNVQSGNKMHELKQKDIEREAFLLAFLLVQPDNTQHSTQRPIAVLCSHHPQKNSLGIKTSQSNRGEK